MLRRSSRLERAADAPSPQIPEQTKAPSRKRQKTAVQPESDEQEVQVDSNPRPKAAPRKRGKLRLITEMPLDILFEIFSLLLPIDVLNLSRASKALRGVLLEKSAVSIWKQSFLNVESAPPPRPDDLTEPQYVNLLWGKHCFFCGVYTTLVSWDIRIRACKTCIASDRFTLVGDTYHLISQKKLNIRVFCPSWYAGGSGRSRASLVYLTSQFHSICKELEELEERADGDTLRNALLLRNKERREHGYLCKNWQDRQKAKRRNECNDVRNNRKAAILEKLEQLGWKDEISNFYTRRGLVALPAFRENKDLTEKRWTTIAPVLISYLEDVKRRRLRDERISLIRNRIALLGPAVDRALSSQPISDVQPSLYDICALPQYRTILESPSGMEITAKNFTELLSQLPEQSAQWRKSNKETVLRLLPSALKKTSGKSAVDPLELCTTFFRCHSCKEPISFPRILSHVCLLAWPGEVEEEDIFFRSCRQSPWIHGHEGIAFDAEASSIVATLIKMCGQDPKTTTTTEMDNLDPRFECVRCPHPRQGRLVMQWRIALLHELEEHYGDDVKKGCWKVLGAEDTAIAKTQELKAKRKPAQNLLCLQCNNWRTYTKLQMQNHLETSHNTDSFEGNVMCHPDTTLRLPPLAVRLK